MKAWFLRPHPPVTRLGAIVADMNKAKSQRSQLEAEREKIGEDQDRIREPGRRAMTACEAHATSFNLLVNGRRRRCGRRRSRARGVLVRRLPF